MRFALPLVLTACGHPAPPHAPITAHAAKDPAPAGFATCDFVTLDDGVLTAWRFTPTGVDQLGHVAVAAPPAQPATFMPGQRMPKLEWADRDHLFVSPDAGTVLEVTAAGIEPLAIPDVASQLPKPDDNAMETTFGKQYATIDLVVRDGEVWWSQCPWSYPNDGGYCAGWISARLWPSPKTVHDAVSPREDDWPDVVGPRCEATPPDEQHELYSTHLLAPNRLLVLWGYHSEFDSPPPDSWDLRERCDGEPLASGSDPRPARDGLWLSSEDGHTVIRRADVVIGRVPNGDALAIRPRATSRQK